jgi:hypothetical protein
MFVHTQYVQSIQPYLNVRQTKGRTLEDKFYSGSEPTRANDKQTVTVRMPSVCVRHKTNMDHGRVGTLPESQRTASSYSFFRAIMTNKTSWQETIRTCERSPIILLDVSDISPGNRARSCCICQTSYEHSVRYHCFGPFFGRDARYMERTYRQSSLR